MKSTIIDLDGTLAPLGPRPELAEVPPATLAAVRRFLERLAEG